MADSAEAPFEADDSDIAEFIPASAPLAATDSPPPPSPPKPRYYCAGAKRVDEESGRRWCDYKSPKKWQGRCPGCRRLFDCLPISSRERSTRVTTLAAETLAAAKPLVRIPTGIAELDRVIGGGVVLGNTILLKAKRGSGKTTLLLQACDQFARGKLKACFASGEMTQEALIDYAKRLGITNPNIMLFANAEGVSVEALFDDVLAFGARLVCLDSVQVATARGMKGDIGQPTMMDAVINKVTSFANRKKRAFVVIGHQSKEEDFAGSEKMQHTVDALLEMNIVPDEDGVDTDLRTLMIAGKSRQGATNVVAHLEMTEKGLMSPSSKAMRAAGLVHG